MHVNKDTVMCISVASRPSNFGTTVHNAAYRALGLDFLYKAFGISDIAGAIAGVRALGIRGCSVSMPFKEAVIEYLDELDATAQSIGAVNTVVNDNEYLTGYNTDAYGAQIALQTLDIQSSDRVLLLGAGGAAKAIKYALQQLGIRNVLVSNRTTSKAEKLIEDTDYEMISWPERNQVKADVVINATSVGMQPIVEAMPIDENLLRSCRAVMDVVVSPLESRLIKEATDMGKKVVPGYKMSLHQAAAQFRLYTGEDAPIIIMERAIITLLQPH